MATIERSEFIAALSNKSLDLNTFASDPQVNTALATAQTAPGDWIGRADLDGNGAIFGTDEYQRLFKQLDDFDHNGKLASFESTNPDGSSTVQGLLNLRIRSLAQPLSTSLGAQLAEAGKSAVLAAFQSFQDALTTTGVGNLCGDGSAFAKMSEAKKRSFLAQNQKPGTTAAMPKLTSCVGFVMDCVGEAYKSAGLAARWTDIRSLVIANAADGTVLMQELEKDGWQAIYWNPDVKCPADGDSEHPWTYQEVKKGRDYYGSHPHEMILNYRPSPGSSTPQDTSGIDKLAQVPFWVAVTNGGYHCFTGLGSRVHESHQKRNPTDSTCLESGPFAQFGLYETPSTQKYNSGVILVPPGLWPTA